MMYRIGAWFEGEIFLGEVDDGLQPIGEFHRVAIPLESVSYEDPRFFIYKNQLHFSFVVVKPNAQRTAIGVVTDELAVRDCRIIERVGSGWAEKNWVFFSHGEDELYLTYSMGDGIHRVHRVVNDLAEPCFETLYRNPWRWGQARGGTPLVARDGLLYGFFHGTGYAPRGEPIRKRYFMGAYAITPEPPFSIVKMSASPLYAPVEGRFIGTAAGSLGRLMSVVFPSGLLLLESGHWLVAAGHNDHAIKVFKVSHAELDANLVSTVPR